MVSAKPETFQGVVTRDFRRGNVLVRTNFSGSQAVEQTLDKIRTYIAQNFPAGIGVVPTGNLVLLTGTSSDIVAGQVKSLFLALALIFAVLSIGFLSTRVGFLALLPNVLPILMFFGLLGWAGIYLNLGTSLIATIALALAVDSTIHYMARLSHELEGEVDQRAAMQRTLRAVGLPITYTSAALLLGFLTFSISDFVPIRSFGTLAAMTLSTALLVNIFVLPALLSTTKIITLWDLVSVKLGDDPGSSIPMLKGLRPAQARIVVLMGEIRKFAPGDWIVRQGELGDSMYVIINGDADVWVGQGDDRRKVAVMKRGDVFGEMALVRHAERSADVVAAADVEVLSVDQRFLTRIQRRYPRIASKVFLNLTRILSDRLERMTNQVVGLRKAS
jgi:CRP-like cAMP-binding protein